MSGVILLFLFAVALSNNCKGNNISDQRLCFDAKCSVPISLAKGMVEYVRNQEEGLSFHRGDELTIYSKSAGSRKDLWGAELRGVRGYVPKAIVKEFKIYHREDSLKYTVTTGPLEEPESKESIVNDEKEGSDETPQSNEGDRSSELPSDTDIKSDSYNVIDGTTIYLDPAVVSTPTVSSLNTYYSEGSSATIEPTPFSSTMEEMSTLSAVHSEMSPISPTTMKEKSEELEKGLETSEAPSKSESVLKSMMDLVPDLFSGGGEGSESDSSKLMAKDDQKEEPSNDKDNIKPFADQPTLNSAEKNLGDPVGSEKINDVEILQKDEEVKENGKVKSEMEDNEEDNEEDDDDGGNDDDDDGGEDEEDDDDEEETEGEREEMMQDETLPRQSDSQGSVESRHTHSNGASSQEERADKNMASEDKNFNVSKEEPLAGEQNQKNDDANVNYDIPPTDSPMDDKGMTDSGSETFPEGTFPDLKHDEEPGGHSSFEMHDAEKGDLNPNEQESGSLSQSVADKLQDKDSVIVGRQHNEHLNSHNDILTSTDSNTPKSEFSEKTEHVNDFLTPDTESPMNDSRIHQDEVLSGHPGEEDEHKSAYENAFMASHSTTESTSNSIPFESEEKRSTLITGDQDLVIDNNDISHSSAIPPSQFEHTNPGIVYADTERTDANPTQNLLDEKEIHLDKPYEGDLVPKDNTNDVTGRGIDSNINKETQAEVTEINNEEGNVGETPNASDSLEQMLVSEESNGFFSMLAEPFNSGYTFLAGMLFGKEDEVKELDVQTSDVGAKNHFETEDVQQHSARNEGNEGAAGRYTSLFGSNSLSHCESDPTDSQCENLYAPLPAVGEPSSNGEGQSSTEEEESSSWMEFFALPLGYEYSNIFDIHMPSYGALIYPLITGGVVLCFFLGHYFIEGKRRDELLLAKINSLEKELTVSSKECLILKERLKVSESKSSSLDDSTEVINSIKSELEKVQNEKAQLEKELEATTEAGLEMEHMVSQFLSSQPDSKSLMESIEQLQTQANKQQTKISILENSLISKTQENEKLAQELSLTEQKVQELEEDLKQVSENLNERDQDHCKQYEELKKLSENQKKEYEEDLKNKLVETEMAMTRCKSLEKSLTESKDTLAVKENEIGVLQECLQKLKVSNGDDPEKAAVQFQEMLDFGKLKAELISVTKERDSLKEELMGEEDARKLLEDHVKVIREEVEKLRKCHEAAEREKVEAQTRLEVLSSYFKEKESQLQKELGIQEAMRVQKHTDASTIMQRMKSLEEEVENYSKEDSRQKMIINGDANVKGKKEIGNSSSEKERKEKKVIIPKILESTSKKGTKEIICTASEKECQDEKHSKTKVLDNASDKSTKEIVAAPPERHGKEEKHLKTKCLSGKEDNHSKVKVDDNANEKSTKEIHSKVKVVDNANEKSTKEIHSKVKVVDNANEKSTKEIHSKVRVVDNANEKSTKEIVAAPPEKHGKEEKKSKTKCVHRKEDNHSKAKVAEDASDKSTKEIVAVPSEKPGKEEKHLKTKCLSGKEDNHSKIKIVDNTSEKTAKEIVAAPPEKHGKVEKHSKAKVVDIASDKSTKDINATLPEKHGSQNETLKKEILDQERGYKTQVATFEKKAHENWVAARQAERKLEEAKQEAGQLRNRLTMVDKSNPVSSSQNGDDSKPNLSMMDSNGELSASPLHLGLASNTSVDMLLSEQHPLYLDPNSSPPHVGGGGGRLPPPPLLPPFPPPPFPPRSPYHHPLSPPLPFMPPPPDSALYPSAVDGHRPPPLGRMSSPPPPPSPSHSPHLPSVDSRAGEYPSPYRDRGGGGRSSSPSPGLYRGMPLDDRGMVDEWGVGRYRTPPPHNPNHASEFSIPPPYPPHHHRPHWEDDSHHPTSSFRPLPTQLDPLREHKGGRSKGSHSSESDMLDKSSRHGGKL